jgi:hypothetical protein
MNFFPHTSIDIKRQPNGLIAADKKSMNDFWIQVDAQLEDGLSGGIGCYIFSVRAGKGSLPWYVGLAEKQSFRKECFTAHKLMHYNNAIAKRKGTPLLTLVAKYTPRDKLVTPNGGSHRDIQFLETMLIANCLSRNPELYNVRDTKLLREIYVPGLVNTQPGKAPASVSDFKTLIGA